MLACAANVPPAASARERLAVVGRERYAEKGRCAVGGWAGLTGLRGACRVVLDPSSRGILVLNSDVWVKCCFISVASTKSTTSLRRTSIILGFVSAKAAHCLSPSSMWNADARWCISIGERSLYVMASVSFVLTR